MAWLHVLGLLLLLSDVHGSPAVTYPLVDGSSTVNVVENSATGDVIATVLPTTAGWTYTITPGTAPFTVNAGGSVQVNGPLDYEGTRSYVLTITTTDAADPPPTNSTLTVQVTNVFDEAPVFGGTTTATIDEEVGTTVTAGFNVSDVETGYGDTLTYSLAGPDAAFFYIDPATGVITARSPIDYDSGVTSLSITVQVTDSNGNTASQAVTVTVNDINDNTPVCNPGVVHITIAENAAGPSNQATVGCTDNDGTATNNVITYSIFSGDDAAPNKKFSLTGTTLATTAVPLDYETKSQYTLVIHAVDSGAGPLTGTVSYIVEVGAVNDNTPAWGTNVPAGTAFLVPENSASGTSIVTLVATDDDLGTDGALTYQIVSTAPNTGGFTSGIFSLDAATNELSTLAALNREAVQSYDVVVRATDGGTPSRSTPDLTLTITITDINDNAPVFTGASVLTGSVPEGSAAGTSILTLVASDADATSTLTFSVSSGDVTPPKFQFNTGVPGQLETQNVIDLDQPTNDANTWSLTVIVKDGGSPELTGTTYVTVTVTPVNNHTPVMNTPTPSATVPLPENTGIGTSVATVTGSDNDYGADGTLTYSITGGNTGTAFNIDPNLGDIRTQTALDYDLGTRQYLLEVTATDGGTPSLAASTTVTIDITNVNDNTPSCTSSSLTVPIAEAQAAVTAVTTLSCTDGDPTDTLTYTITGGNVPVFFSIVTGTGAISTTQTLNYEGTTSYNLTVSVTDDGTSPSSTNVIVIVMVTPVNEFSPVFAPATYTASVIENSGSGDDVVQVTATDADVGASDGTVRYSITGGDPQGRFAINQTTGQITVANTLDRESTASYTLTVSAADDVPGSVTQNVVTTTVTVTVTDYNDNQPKFNPIFYTANPIESSAPLSVLLTVTATDDDLPPNSNLVFAIDPAGDPTGIFEFNGADLRIAAGKNLSFATTPTFDLRITATDGGTPTLTSTPARVLINVQAANLNAPVFTNPNEVRSIAESTPIGTTVLTSNATDPDSGSFGTVTYSIVNGNDSFVIDATSGDVLVWSQPDYDTPPTSYNLTLEATDGGGAVTNTWLYINLTDVNDNYPQFASNIFNVAIDENLPATTSIAQIVATDADSGTNGEISYNFTTVSTSFAIGLTTGDITTSVVLDYETRNTYSLVVQATDKGTPANSAVAYVVITLNDLNDNAPIFTPADIAVDLTENVAVGTSVYTVTASDADSAANSNGLFTFGLVHPNFAVDPNTGEITTTTNIDRESATSYVLNVTATDQNGVGPNVGTGTVTVNILDQNDNDPVITGTYIKTLPENTAVGTVIYTITATDADSGRNAQLTYAITAGDPTNDFRIVATTGLLQLNKPLDRETTSSYVLTITVTDNGVVPRADTVTVSLTISDNNDNDPIFQNLPYNLSIAENVPPGSTVGYVTALDADTGTNGAVVYDFVNFWQGNNTHFSINGATGEITANGGLDRETTNTYIIWLRASDNGIPVRSASLNITITVLDLNDNNPVFGASSYSGSVSESATAGTSILTIAATDKDIGVNAAISFSIATPGTRADTFLEVNSTTGVLSLKTAVDRETDPSFLFAVLAIDDGATPRTSTTSVTVTVTDVNDNAPVLSPQFYNTETAYNGICTKIITTVEATDADSGINGLMVFYLIQSTYNYLFLIDASTGVYSLQSEAPNNFKFFIEVSVRDSGSPVRTATTSAVIRTDTFDPNVVAVTFKLNVDEATFRSQEATFTSSLQSLIRVTYPNAMFRVWCVELRGAPVPTRRRLLQSTGAVNVHAYTVADSSTNTVANQNVDKTFLTASQTLQFFATNPQGTPSAAITGGNLTALGIQSVTPYYQTVTPWAQTAEGIAVLTIISLVVLALIITAIIVTIVACRKRKNRKPITPVRKGKRARRASITEKKDSPEVSKENPDAYRARTPPPVYSEKPLPMRSGQDGIASIRNPRQLTSPATSVASVTDIDFDGRAVDAATGKVYSYNTKHNIREWLTTPEGRSVKVTHH